MNIYKLLIESTVDKPFIQQMVNILKQHNACLIASQLKRDSSDKLQWHLDIGWPADSPISLLQTELTAHHLSHHVSVAQESNEFLLLIKVPETHYTMTLVHKEQLTQEVIDQGRNLVEQGFMVEKSLGMKAWEMHFSALASDVVKVKQQSRLLADATQTDIIIRPWQPNRRDIRLAAFDMDSTLIQAEVIDELAKEAGVATEIMAVTRMAMQGGMDFSESLKQRLALLAGLPEKALSTAHQRIALMPGAKRLFQALRALGCKTALLSGGFTWFAEQLQHLLKIDSMVANHLEIKDQRLTGRVVGRIVNALVKKEAFEQLLQQWDIPVQQTIALGDGANDIPMLQAAGTGIAFHAKPKVKQTADVAVTYSDLDSVLYLAGWHEDEIDLLLKTR